MNPKKTQSLCCPFVSIVMPIRNEEALIARSVSALLRQDYPAEKTEIIIADGMSEDATIDIIRHIPGAERIRIISNPQQIQAAGLNRAIELARGDVIVRVDGHTIIAADYIWRCVEALSTGADNVGGRVRQVGLSEMGKAIAAASSSRFAIPSAFRWSERAQYTDTVYLGAWRREVLERVGLFDENFDVNEDYELNYRIRRAGGRIYLSPAICSEYYGQQTLRKVAQQYFRYGRWKPQTVFKHPASLRIRHLVAPATVAFLAGGTLLPPEASTFKRFWWFAIVLYLLLNIGFSLYVSRRRAVPAWRLPLVFVTIHTAWGIGFWFGILRILFRLSARLNVNES